MKLQWLRLRLAIKCGLEAWRAAGKLIAKNQTPEIATVRIYSSEFIQQEARKLLAEARRKQELMDLEDLDREFDN